MNTDLKGADIQLLVEQKTSDVTAKAAAFIITTSAEENAAVEIIRVIRDLKKEIDITFDDAIKKAHEAHKAMLAGKKRHLDPLDAAEKQIREKIIRFQNEQETARQQEEARLNELARKEKQRNLDAAAKRIAALLEKSGDVAGQIAALEAESQADGLSDEERAAIESSVNILRVKHDNLAQAVASKQADAERTQYVAPVTVLPQSPKVQGTSFTIKKKAAVVNLMDLIKAVAAGTVPIGALEANMSALDKLINAGAIVPGVSFTTERILSVRK